MKLPNRRGGYNLDFNVGKQTFTALLNHDSDWNLREVFIHAGKVGSDVETVMMEAAICLTHALKLGASADAMRKTMPRRESGEAEGPIGRLLDIVVSEHEREVQKELLS